VIGAELAALRRDGSTWRSKLQMARAGFDRMGMALHRAAVDVAVANDDANDGARARALGELQAAGAKNPIALASTLFPRRALAAEPARSEARVAWR
jgi:hypothetical protein